MCSRHDVINFAPGLFVSTAFTPPPHLPALSPSRSLAFLPTFLVHHSYAYLDGEKHVRVSIAMDAIVQGVIEARKGTTTTSLAYLCSPTDVFVVDKVRCGVSADACATGSWCWRCSSFTFVVFTFLPVRFLFPSLHPPPVTAAGGTRCRAGELEAQGRRTHCWRAHQAPQEDGPAAQRRRARHLGRREDVLHQRRDCCSAGAKLRPCQAHPALARHACQVGPCLLSVGVCHMCVCVLCVVCCVCVCVVCLSHAPLWCWAPPIPFFSPLCARACARVCVCAGARAAPCPPTLRRRLQRFLWCTTRSSRLRTAAFRSFSPLRSPGRWVFCASWGVSHTQTHTHTDTHTRTHTHAHTHTRVKMVA